MTSTTVPDIETMSASFPEEVLPILQDKPDFTSVRDLRDQIYANATSVDCMLGGGNNGYMAHHVSC
jgi:hypothetical protein